MERKYGRVPTRNSNGIVFIKTKTFQTVYMPGIWNLRVGTGKLTAKQVR
jgi:hypothetical protein